MKAGRGDLFADATNFMSRSSRTGSSLFDELFYGSPVLSGPLFLSGPPVLSGSPFLSGPPVLSDPPLLSGPPVLADPYHSVLIRTDACSSVLIRAITPDNLFNRFAHSAGPGRKGF